MNKFIICITAALICFTLGYIAATEYTKAMNVDFYNELDTLYEANGFKRELIDAQYDALNQAETVMWNNNLFDSDGSDAMFKYTTLKAKVDSLLDSQL